MEKEKETIIEEQPVQKSKRDAFYDRMKGRYPEENFDDEDAFYDRLGKDYDDYDGAMQRESAITEMFDRDPRTASFFLSMQKDSKEHPLAVLIRQFGPDFEEALKDPSKVEGLIEAQQDYLERMQKSEELATQYETNIEATRKLVSDMQSERGEEEVTKAVDLITQMSKDLLLGKISKESIEMALKANSHDADVAEASMVGEVKGKNAKIKENLRKRTGDGTQQLAGKNASGGARPQRNLGALGALADRGSIFDK